MFSRYSGSRVATRSRRGALGRHHEGSEHPPKPTRSRRHLERRHPRVRHHRRRHARRRTDRITAARDAKDLPDLPSARSVHLHDHPIRNCVPNLQSDAPSASAADAMIMRRGTIEAIDVREQPWQVVAREHRRARRAAVLAAQRAGRQQSSDCGCERLGVVGWHDRPEPRVLMS